MTAVVAVILAVLLAAEVARLTVSYAVADDNPQRALRLAPSAPWALASTAMGQVGQAAARGGNPDEATFRQLRTVAVSGPLRTEPFLVEAAMAERAGAYDRAKQLLVQARSRAPRSTAARYLYADTAIRQGKMVEGLREMAVLSRLIPNASVQLVPALAQFAHMPGSREKLAGILAQNPQLKKPVLVALASNPDNADLIIALAGSPIGSNVDSRGWQARLLLALMGQGRYERAYDLWRQFALLPAGARPLLFNGSFRDIGAPPPFNWEFSSSPAGMAEPGQNGVTVLYYGRENTVLATQVLVLMPGNYRFDSPVTGHIVAGALSWTLNCVGKKAPLMELWLGGSNERLRSFSVPDTGCSAQTLQLNGHQEDSPEVSDVRIGPATIQRFGK